MFDTGAVQRKRICSGPGLAQTSRYNFTIMFHVLRYNAVNVFMSSHETLSHGYTSNGPLFCGTRTDSGTLRVMHNYQLIVKIILFYWYLSNINTHLCDSRDMVYLNIQRTATHLVWKSLLQVGELLPVSRAPFVIPVKPARPLRLCGTYRHTRTTQVHVGHLHEGCDLRSTDTVKEDSYKFWTTKMSPGTTAFSPQLKNL